MPSADLLGGPEGPLADLAAEYPVRTSPADRAADSTAGPKAVVDSAAAVSPTHAGLPAPKGVALSHAAMLCNASAIADTLYGRGNHDVRLVTLPLFPPVSGLKKGTT